MTSTRKKATAKRVATKTATYYNYGVTKTETNQKGNFASFVVGVFLTVAIYAIARFFGI